MTTNMAEDLAVTYRPIESLKPYERNARTHSPGHISQIAASIQEFGWTNPVLVDEDSGIIAGHGRVEAARSLGMDRVATVTLAGLSSAQKRALVLADNRLALNAGWDAALLTSELGALHLDGFDLGLLGFSSQELAGLLPNGGGLTDPDAIPDAPPARTKAGDIWVLGRHRIICGDATKATDVDAVLAGVKPHLMVTDPPYGVSYEPEWRAKAGVNQNLKKMGEVVNDDRSDWREAWQLFTGSVAYVWHAGRHASSVQDSLESADFEIRSQIVWAKDRFALSRGNYHWQHEPCWYAVRNGNPGQWHGDRSQSTLWNIPARDDKGHGHSTQKPVECMRRPIENNSSEGQAVYEPFLGSGTTIIAAEMTGRACYAIELNPIYVDISVERWQQFAGKSATLESTGEEFTKVNYAQRPEAAAVASETG